VENTLQPTRVHLSGPPTWKTRWSPIFILGATIGLAIGLWLNRASSPITVVFLGLMLILLLVSACALWAERILGPPWLAVEKDRLSVRQGLRRRPLTLSAGQVSCIRMAPGKVEIVNTAEGSEPIRLFGATPQILEQLRELLRAYAATYDIPLTER
jgi:hypothetical protein